jgi:hypothetical protein
MTGAMRRGPFALCFLVLASLSGGCVNTGRLIAVQVPPGFAGTWVRNVADSRIATGDGPAPDTVRFTDTVTYRTRHLVRDESKATEREILAVVPQLADKIVVSGRQSDEVRGVKSNSITVEGDTLVIRSEWTQLDQGVIVRATTREYLSPDHVRLISETSIAYPVREREIANGQATGYPGPTSRLLVFDKTR